MGLTSKKVLKLLRRGEPGRYFDKHGLYLVVASRDSAHWEKRYQLDGKEHYHGLGSTAAFSLAEARQRNRRAAQLLEDGICPIAPTDVRVEEAIEDVTRVLGLFARLGAFGAKLDKRSVPDDWGDSRGVPKHLLRSYARVTITLRRDIPEHTYRGRPSLLPSQRASVD